MTRRTSQFERSLLNFSAIANAISIYIPAVKITSYKFNLTSIFAGSITRSFVINGIEGANWALQCNYTPGNINIVNTSGVIGVDGLSVVTVIFPASAVNRTYTFALTGDLAASFDTSLGQTSTPIVYQYVQSTLGFQFSSTNASITLYYSQKRRALRNKIHMYLTYMLYVNRFIHSTTITCKIYL